ncbi:TonB-dependent receptor [Sphingomonas spermidinifaciens]|uniref:TonB-dependent receptor n=1 Tax=Sphingomonas spermidinifaciens TaxID=1141889 RepID=UPI001FE90D95|nr:TonB-dependent receptor [Sphingomonas spermidinifaciens]
MVLASTAMVMVVPAALAQVDGARDYDMPSQDLGSALRAVAQQSGTQVIAPTELVADLRAPALKGRYRPEQAVAQLLRGSRLRAAMVGSTLVVQRDDTAQVGNVSADAGGEILVTGTRIRGEAPVGVPVITLDREALQQGGFATTAQLVQSIPQNFYGGANENTGSLITGTGGGNSSRGAGVNLRGLGQMSTLVLINGDRPPLGGAGGTFSDLSMVPASVVERIEIVPDGASAIYGSDAVAGVVNVVTRLNFRGAETSLRFGTADGDSQEYQGSQLLGTRWSSGHAVVAYEFYKRDRLRASDRDYATDDLRAFGGPDRRPGYASPGTIYAGGRSYAVPAGQNGVGLTAAQLTLGAVNRQDSWFGIDILPQQQRHSLFAAFSQDLSTDLRFYGHGLATWRRYDVNLRSGADTRRTVPVTNPFYLDPVGTRQPVGVDYSFTRDLGPEGQSGTARAFGVTAGLEATFGRWTVDAHGTWGRQDEAWTLRNRINSARLALALADSNPTTAYNLFGDGPSTNRATIDSIRGYIKNDYYGVVWSGTLRADGPLAAVPAGDLRLAIGGEYREDRYRNGATTSYTSSLTELVTPPTPLPELRSVKSLYVELLVPVLGGEASLPGFRKLDVSLALRTEDYSDFGRTTNPKIGLSWEPLSGVTARGSYGKSFRAPIFNELRQDPGSIAIFAFAVADPQASSGTSNIIVIRGNDPNLRPERAETWTLGLDLSPAFVPGFRIGATWFNVDYRDRIASPAANLASFLINRDIYNPILTPNPSGARVAELYASPYYRNLQNIPATAQFVAVADARLQNLSVSKQAGLDLDVAYGFDLSGDRVEIGAVGTYIFQIRQQLTPTAQAIDVVDTVGNPVDLHVRARATFQKAGFSAALFGNYVDSYVNKTAVAPQRVSSWTTFDLNLAYDFEQSRGPLHGLRIALNGSNIFDRDPPYVSYFVGTYTAGFDGENANPLGRVVSLQITKKW